MFTWLHKFFYSDDPDIKFADGLSEYEAAMYEELLANNGVIAMRKNMLGAYDRYWRPMLLSANNFALFVKDSDVERAREVIEPLLRKGQLTRRARRLRRRVRRRD